MNDHCHHDVALIEFGCISYGNGKICSCIHEKSVRDFGGILENERKARRVGNRKMYQFSKEGKDIFQKWEI